MPKIFLSIFLCFCIAFLNLNQLSAQISSDTTQPVIDFASPQVYEIGGITVKGADYSDANAIIAFSGLTEGKNIRLPGEQISAAIRKLWKQGLFVDIQVYVTKKVNNTVFLEIAVKEFPRFARHGYKGVKKGIQDDLNEVVNRHLLKGRAATTAMKDNAKRALFRYFEDKGYLDAKINIIEEEDKILKNSVRWVFDIDRGKRVRIAKINIKGNESFKTKKLYRKMKETKRHIPVWSIFKPSKFIESEFENDKKAIIAYYNKMGFRDAQIARDSVYIVVNEKGKKEVHIDLDIQEERVYKFGKINFRGNVKYPTSLLREILGIQEGDIYNSELLATRLNYDQGGRDISTLYMDNGHLFFRVDPVEKGIRSDSVDLEIRITEGPVAIIDKVIIKGNDRTHEHVIRRELRTLPGQKFSRSDIIRSQRELMALNYFNPEAMGINTPVNQAKGTVDIEYTVEERSSDQLELSAGWGGLGRGVIGTLGVTFNNFSLRNLLNTEAWNPLPQGDGQRLSLRIQTNGRFFQSYNFSFTEPWLGGKKPNALSVSAFHTRINNGLSQESSSFQQLMITGASVGLGTRLRWPDDNFTYQIALNYQNMDLFRRYDFIIPTGSFHNFSLSQTISRSTIFNPMFPKKGSRLSLSLKLTLPYSLMSGKDYAAMEEQQRFKWVEYHKWDFEYEWYTEIFKNFVFKAGAKMGFLGYYNKDIGLSPFERYELGGDGISNFVGLQGKDIISLRGYRDPTLDVSEANRLGAAVYNKITAEFRYLLSPNPSATIWVLAFAEAGNAWSDFKSYNPFELKRSVGAGLRVFLPMFGTLGFDYGIGFDKPHLNNSRKVTDYGAFNIILGFEPK